MKTKKRKLLITLLLSAIALPTASLGQTVSDSCFTQKEINFFISQSFTIKEQANTLLYKDSILSYNDSINNALSVAIRDKNEQLYEAHHQTAIQSANYQNCKEDSKFDKDEIKRITKKNKVAKFLNYVFGGTSLGFGSYIGLQSLLKK